MWLIAGFHHFVLLYCSQSWLTYIKLPLWGLQIHIPQIRNKEQAIKLAASDPV